MEGPVEVLICGSGPAGLTLAIDLARRGVSFRLIEKRAEPFAGSRGKGIQPRTLEIFEDLGILEKVSAAGGRYPPQRKYRTNGTFIEEEIVQHADPTPAEPYPMPLMVPQFATERVMRDRLHEFDHHVEFGCELSDFEQDESGVTARIASRDGQRTLRAAYLVGTDGGRSFVRQALGVDFPGKTLGVRGLVADLELTGLSRDAWHRCAEGDMKRQISLCPLAGTDLFQLQAPVPLEGEIDTTATGLAAMIAERTGRTDIEIGAVSWASAFTMNARLADAYSRGRIFLAGDAAHTHPPTGGQGLNTSIQDVYNLGWKLAAVLQGAPSSLLQSYEEERRPVAAGVLGLSTSLLDAMKRGIMRRGREVRQLDVGYRDSSLSLERRTKKGSLRAGDRAPDAPVRWADGRPARLFDVFRGPQWTLIGDTGDNSTCPRHPTLTSHSFGPDGDLVDYGGHFRDAYGLRSGERVLVRPDGYVGAMVASERVSELCEYLQRVGLTADPRQDIADRSDEA